MKLFDNLKRITCVAVGAVTVSLAMVDLQPTSAQAQQVFDCAHGPDTYRTRNVADWDSLNIRSGPSSRTRVVGQIPAHGSGVHCLGPCKGNWCRISWRGIIGWTNMRYLGE